MRVLYIDIDSQRADHLGCYGYHRRTSPNIDRIASEGVRFENFYASDAPCLPSRTALFGGRFGIHNGVINHGGLAADPFLQGINRGFQSQLGHSSWMHCLRQAGLKTVTVSPFGERHSAWHWYANFSEVYNPGQGGMERADEVAPIALDWLQRNGRQDNWFLHVNFWDPHGPYRTPKEFGDPFKDEPAPDWLSEEVRQRHWRNCGPHSAQEVAGFGPAGEWAKQWPRWPTLMDSMDAVKRMFDGYDTGVLYADHYIGRLFDKLADLGVLDETAIIISADHGENLGELNIYGDHQTADQITTRLPLIIRWPGITHSGDARVDRALHYHVDMAATVVELLGKAVPGHWDGESFAEAFKNGAERGRPYLVVSQGAWSCQRAVRFEDYLCIRSYHDGYHGFPDTMLFDIEADPHEQSDLADKKPEVTQRALSMLETWHMEMMRRSTSATDPMWTVIGEGGPWHVRGELPAYLNRLKETGRSDWADLLAARHRI